MGNLPVATATGGLSDSIVDYSTDPDMLQDSFIRKPHRDLSMLCVSHLKLTKTKYNGKNAGNGMKTDFSWATSAEKYYQVYQNLMNKD